jgi:hypothetical protein
MVESSVYLQHLGPGETNMARTIRMAVALVLVGLGSAAQAQVLFQDHFNGPALDPAWQNPYGGSYYFSSGNLDFVTEQGDFTRWIEDTVGPEKHTFVVDVAASQSTWSAVVRVRYMNPDRNYERVQIYAWENDDRFLRLAYQRGGGGRVVTYAANYDTSIDYSGDGATVTFYDYFWLRMDRSGDLYKAYWSADTTTDPDAVNWSLSNTATMPLQNPSIAIGGANTWGGFTGKLAEFDYFRLSIPEPGTAGAVLLGALLVLRRRR